MLPRSPEGVIPPGFFVASRRRRREDFWIGLARPGEDGAPVISPITADGKSGAG